MKLYYIGVLKNESKPAHELAVEKDLSSYSRFTRDKYALCQSIISCLTDRVFSYGQFMSLFSKTVAERTRPGQRQDVEEKCTGALHLHLPSGSLQI